MVRLSSLDGDPVYRIREEVISEPAGDRRPRSHRWQMFNSPRARSERSHRFPDDVYSYATSRRTAHDLLYGTGAYSEGPPSVGRGHIHTRFNASAPRWVHPDEVYSETTGRTRRNHHSQVPRVRSIISRVTERAHSVPGYLDDPVVSKSTGYLDEGGENRSVIGDYARQTFPRFVMPGWAHLCLGLFILIIGCVDIGWTASKYGSGCNFETTVEFDGCASENAYNYIAIPIWGGLIMIITGVLPFCMTPYRLLRSKAILYIFVLLCFVLLIGICPAIVTLYILSITENKASYWAEADDGDIVLQDRVRFALAFVVLLLAFMDWIVALVAILTAFICPPRSEAELGRDPYAGKMYRDYVEPAPLLDEEPAHHSRRNYPSRVPEIITTEVHKPRSDRAGRAHSEREYRVHSERAYRSHSDMEYRPHSDRDYRSTSGRDYRSTSDREYRPHSEYRAGSDRGGYHRALSDSGHSRTRHSDVVPSRSGLRPGDRVVHEEVIRPGGGGRSGRIHHGDVYTVDGSEYGGRGGRRTPSRSRHEDVYTVDGSEYGRRGWSRTPSRYSDRGDYDLY